MGIIVNAGYFTVSTVSLCIMYVIWYVLDSLNG